MIKGSIQVVDVPRSRGELVSLTNRVEHNNRAQARGRQKPAVVDGIEHVFYVIKENRTYDQVLGDLPEGNGDPALTLFGEESAPNQHELARRYGIFDDFFADAEVTADGHNWITQANSTDYVDKTWPFNYSPSVRDDTRAFDFGNDDEYPLEPLASDWSVLRPAAAQTVGYLWDNAYAHGVSFRDYGEYTGAGDCKTFKNDKSKVTHLQQSFHTVAPEFAGFELTCSDHADRIPEWRKEFAGYVERGDLPALNIMRLANDHTRGTTAGAPTPQAFMADNDLALGQLVETISRSPYWATTAIFVTEDDAQNGPDHVDAHRTLAFVISPFSKHGAVDSTHYDTASMVATIEDMLGLPPMSITDARVARMWKAFRSEADLGPYDARMPEVTPFGADGYATNPVGAPLSEQSASWDFSREDAIPEIALNEAIWKSVKGRHSAMPRPKHEHIIGATPNDEDD
jgi:hypothetical protein